MEYCPICKGQGVPLGVLGMLFWFRCRQCGMDFSIHVSMADDFVEDCCHFGDGDAEE